MCPVSVATIVHHRQTALVNLIKGLDRSRIKPVELIVVYMNEPPYILPEASFPIYGFELHTQEKLPLAKARNLARTHATRDDIAFLDADCVPHPNLLDIYMSYFAQGTRLWIGPVRYLKKGATDDPLWLEKMDQLSRPDLIRNLGQMVTYELFWSLNFGCTKAVFDKIGGFDESYKGYGAEDTDFAFSARKNQVAIGSLPAVAYHQYHPSYSPPINHLDDIVTNACRFKQKWQVWPMTGWLKQFQQMGFIEWTNDKLTIIAEPSETDLKKALKP